MHALRPFIIAPPLFARRYGVSLFVVATLLLLPWRVGVVVGESMSPSLANGAIYVLDRGYYASRPARGGDAVVLNWRGATYVKRVLAVGGDVVHLLKFGHGEDPEILRDWQVGPMQRPSKHRTFGKGYQVIDSRVPEGFRFVVGDNLQSSIDSRQFGVVPLEAILGKVLPTPPTDSLIRHLAVNRAGTNPS